MDAQLCPPKVIRFDFHFISVSFDDLRDEGELRYFNELPTSFELDAEAVDRLRGAARRLLRESREFQALREKLASPRLSVMRARLAPSISHHRSAKENPSMVTPPEVHRSHEKPCASVALARHGSSLASAVLVALLAVTISGCAHTSGPGAAADAAPATQAVAKRMVELGTEHGERFLSHSQTRAIRNMLGGARGVFIAPDLTAEAAIVGIERGTGFLLRRHGKDWSDPVFVLFSEASIGYQAGVKESHMLILLMTDTAVDNFVKGKMELGGTGGFAIGTYGMGVSGTGELKGGLEMILLSTNTGRIRRRRLGRGHAGARRQAQ